jgi:Alpha/beta hydrolase family
MLGIALYTVAPSLFAQGTTAAAPPPTEIRINGVFIMSIRVSPIRLFSFMAVWRITGRGTSRSSLFRHAIARLPTAVATTSPIPEQSSPTDTQPSSTPKISPSSLRLRPVRLIGHSYGAYVALLVALRHPELVRSLVLSEPPILRWLPALAGGKPLFTEFMSTVWEPTTRGFRKSDAAGVEAAVNGFGELGYSGTDEKMTFATLPPEARGMLLENAPEWKALTMSKDAFPEVRLDAIRGLATPTLLLSGGRSLKLSHAIDEQLLGLLPNGRRTILPDATHEMWSEFPEECRSAAIAFLADH